MNYSKWEEERIDINDLNLDPFNPRFPLERKNGTQEELLQELVEKYDVEIIASMIAFYGYFPTESLIAYRENGKIFVIEGNRRAAACKILLSPKKAPFGYEKRFETLSKQLKFKDDIKKIKVVFAPNRDAAIPILLAKHTRNTVLDWDSIIKQKFYADLLEKHTADELKIKYGIKEKELNASLIVEDIYNAAKALEYPDDIAEIVKDEQRFPITTLVRAVNNSEGKKFFKANIENGKLSIVSTPDDFFTAFKHLVICLATEKLDSRKLNTVKLIGKELKKFVTKDRIKEPEVSLTAPLLIDEALKQYKKASVPTTEKKTKAKRVKKDRKKNVPFISVVPHDFVCASNNERIKDVCRELQFINVEEFPNASSLLLRLFLELVTYNFLHETGDLVAWKAEITLKGDKISPTFPELKKMLDRIIKKNFIANTQINKALKLFVDHNSKEPILAVLNSYVHNFAYHPEKKELRQIYKSLSEYLKTVIK